MNSIDVSVSAGVSRFCSPASARRLRSLSGLSDRELLSRVKDLVARERVVTLEVLAHLNEVERRRLHLGLGYSSIFEYATRHLGYSESAAARRIRVARCIRDYPEVRRFLKKNEVSLVTISMVASILTEGNARNVIVKIRGKSQREVEAIVASYRPPVSMRDRATPVCVAVPVPGVTQLIEKQIDRTATGGSNPAGGSAAGPFQATSESQAQRQVGTHASADHPTVSAPRLEAKFFIQFLASPRFMQKLERAKALLSNKNGALSHEFVLEAALDEFLKDHDPEQRKQRREERKEKAEGRSKAGERAAKETTRSRAAGSNCGAGGVPAESEAARRIPDAVRDAVYVRDKGRCMYVGSNGMRCTSTHHLQIDHVIPRAKGGISAPGNLRLLCERHNKKEAERVLGVDTLRRFRRRE